MTSDDRPKVFVSGCINGAPIRYNETNVVVDSEIWDRWVDEGLVVSFCAELAAGFPVPRRPAETVGGDGALVLAGAATVMEDTGADVTDRFLYGAQLAVQHARASGCVVAVLTDGSPSCGTSYVYDGSFTGNTNPGMGVVAQMLADNGIPVFAESQLDLADAMLRTA
jgi:uncharacterized protein YbbK (DUF523 family)